MENEQKIVKKSLKEEFAKFLEEPSREKLRDFIKNNLGELENCDFKENWPDLDKIARHVLALSNSKGGCIVFGVKQKEDKTFEPVGLSQLKDKSEIKSITKFLPTKLSYDILDFSYPESEYPTIKGMKFQVLIVSDLPEYIPFICSADGKDVRKGAIYVRDKTDSVEVTYEKLQEIINRRLETGRSTTNETELEKHLQHLKALYGMIPQRVSAIPLIIDFLPLKPNPWYPSESFEIFIINMINAKKEKIKSLIT